LSAICDHHWLAGLAGLGPDRFDSLDNVHTFAHGTENAMLAVQPGGLHGTEEKLRSIGIRASVRHGEDTRSSVLEREVFVGELGAVDGLTTGSVSRGKITALAHKIGDHTVERGALEMQRLPGLSHTLLSGAQAAEVFCRLRDHIRTQLHDNAAGIVAADGHVEEHFRVGHLVTLGQRTLNEDGY